MEHIISSYIIYMMLSIQRNYYGITAIYQREYINMYAIYKIYMYYSK